MISGPGPWLEQASVEGHVPDVCTTGRVKNGSSVSQEALRKARCGVVLSDAESAPLQENHMKRVHPATPSLLSAITRRRAVPMNLFCRVAHLVSRWARDYSRLSRCRFPLPGRPAYDGPHPDVSRCVPMYAGVHRDKHREAGVGIIASLRQQPLRSLKGLPALRPELAGK